MVYYTLDSFPNKKCCSFCNTRTVDVLTLGNIYRTDDIIVHYFCLLLASKGVQNGTDKQGLLGFLIKDIRKEIKRGSYIECIYCRKKGATVICARAKCKANFHLPCGLQNNSLHFFCNEYKSFCFKHRSKRAIPASIKENVDENNTACILCFSPVDVRDVYNLIWPPCCKPASLQHKICVQKMAYAAGYYFKCPFCANIKKFNKCMRESGIFIPEQEASWEREPQAFSDLHVPLNCEAKSCRCPKGKCFTRPGTKWKLESCVLCGGSAIHLGCTSEWQPGSMNSIDWQCSHCVNPSAREETRNAIFKNKFESRGAISQSPPKDDGHPSGASVNCLKVEENLSLDEGIVKYRICTNKSPCTSTSTNKVIAYVNYDSLCKVLHNVSKIDELVINNKKCVISLNKFEVFACNGLKVHNPKVKENFNKKYEKIINSEQEEILATFNESACSRSVLPQIPKDLGKNEKDIPELNNVIERSKVSVLTTDAVNRKINKCDILQNLCENENNIDKRVEIDFSNICEKEIILKNLNFERSNNKVEYLPCVSSKEKESCITGVQELKRCEEGNFALFLNKDSVTTCDYFSSNSALTNSRWANFQRNKSAEDNLTSNRNRLKKFVGTSPSVKEKINFPRSLFDNGYKGFLKSLNDYHYLNNDIYCNDKFKIALKQQIKYVQRKFLKPYLKTSAVEKPNQNSLWDYFYQIGEINRNFRRELISFIKWNKCFIFTNCSGCRYVDLFRALIPQNWPIQINYETRRSISAMILAAHHLLKTNSTNCRVIVLGNLCGNNENEDFLLNLKVLSENREFKSYIKYIIICTIPPKQICRTAHCKQLACYNNKLAFYSRKLGYKLWDIRRIFV